MFQLVAISDSHFLLALQVRNHFSSMAVLNKMSTKKPAVLQRAISRFKAVATTKEAREAGQDVTYKVEPQVEGRIRRLAGIVP